VLYVCKGCTRKNNKLRRERGYHCG
jgi:DNA-directed RNA polymerase subunit RPC12/RpoP